MISLLFLLISIIVFFISKHHVKHESSPYNVLIYGGATVSYNYVCIVVCILSVLVAIYTGHHVWHSIVVHMNNLLG
jgi:hypothetical protein